MNAGDPRDIDQNVVLNPYTGNVAGLEIDETPFAAKRAEIQEANAQGVAPPRCHTCGELIMNLNPNQMVLYCNRVCRLARTKKGQKRLLQLMKNSGIKVKV
jgi:hypothetical protein